MMTSSLAAALEQLGFLNMLWLLVLAFVLHELEEWRITDFERRHLTGIPPYATNRSARGWIVLICVVALIWCAVATAPGNPSFAAWIFMPAMAITFLNPLQHIFWSLYFRQYAPGVVTAALFLMPMSGGAAIWATYLGYVPARYVVAWMGFIVAGLVQTVRAGNRMMPVIRGVYRIGFAVAEAILP